MKVKDEVTEELPEMMNVVSLLAGTIAVVLKVFAFHSLDRLLNS